MKIKINRLAVIMAAMLMANTCYAREGAVQTQWGRVNEPSMKMHICATLKADLHSKHGSIDAVDANGRNTQPDYRRIQAAIDSCRGGAVKLVRGKHREDGFLTSPIKLKSNVKLWVDKGVTLFASRSPQDYGGHDCGTADNNNRKTCRPFITADRTSNSGIIGYGKIDGRGGSLLVSGSNANKRSWWDVAWQPQDNPRLHHHTFRMLEINGGKNFTLYGITIENSPGYNVISYGLKGLTVWGVKILTPTLVYTKPRYKCPANAMPSKHKIHATCYTPANVKNTDGIDPVYSNHVLIAYSYISTGDDDISIKSTAKHDSSNTFTIAHNHIYYGHGMSIGSDTAGGIHDIHVYDMSFDGMDGTNNIGAIRIKSDAMRGGKLTKIFYEKVCMRGEQYPIVISTDYTGNKGHNYPDFADITLQNVHDLGSSKYGHKQYVILHGFDQDRQRLPIGLRLNNVVFKTAPILSGSKAKKRSDPVAAHITLGPDPVSFANLIKPSSKNDVTVTDKRKGHARPYSCDKSFPSMHHVVSDSPF